MSREAQKTEVNEMNGYIGFYKGKQYEVQSDTSYHAQQAFAQKYGIKKSYEITIVLCEIEGQQVTHNPQDIIS